MEFLQTHKHAITDADSLYLQHSFNVEDTYSYFYILAKVHKSPISTQPIASISLSLLHGLGR